MAIVGLASRRGKCAVEAVSGQDLLDKRSNTVGEQLASIQRSLLEEKLSVADRNRLSGQVAALRQKLQNLDKRWVLLEEKQRELIIRSPTDGQVVTTTK